MTGRSTTYQCCSQLRSYPAGPGIYHGSLSFSSQEAGDGIIDSAQLLPYPTGSSEASGDMTTSGRLQQVAPTSNEHPVSMALTAYHFLLLYSDRVRVLRALDDRLVYEEVLDIVSGVSSSSRTLLTSHYRSQESASKPCIQTRYARHIGCIRTLQSSKWPSPRRTRIFGKCT